MSEAEAATHRDRATVLIANDQEWTARAVESILEANGYRVIRAHTATAAALAAVEVDPDLVILDLQLPDFSGIELCRRLRADPRFGPELPVIITTAGPSGRDQRLKAYEAGAWEFYGQPLDAEALLHKIAVYHEAYSGVRKFRREAIIDPASGCYTARGMVRRLDVMVADARRHDRGVGCVAWRNPASQATASQAATAAHDVMRHARLADAVGRLDQDEVVLATSDLTEAGATVLAERMRLVFAASLNTPVEQIRSAAVVTQSAADLPDDGQGLLDRLRLAIAA